MGRFLVAVGFICICFGHDVAGAKTENVYFAHGKSAILRPPSGSVTTITGVIWRHGENLAAEWSKGDKAVEFYREFKGRTDLDTTTGVMVISNMIETLAGVYSVEINNTRLEDKYVVKAVEKPPTPNVWPKPGSDADQLELECALGVAGEVAEKAGPVTYWWNTGGSWVQLGKKIVVKNNETMQRVETFSCKMVNEAGEAESEPWPNTFYKKTDLSGLGALAIIPILLGLAVLGYCKKDAIKERFCPGEATENTTVSPEAHPLSGKESKDTC